MVFNGKFRVKSLIVKKNLKNLEHLMYKDKQSDEYKFLE